MDTLALQVYSGQFLNIGINLAINNRLYKIGWMMYQSMSDRRMNPEGTEKLALLFKNDVPVALCWFDGKSAMAFCRPDQRRKGYASKCYKALDIKSPTVRSGEYGSLYFWRALELEVER